MNKLSLRLLRQLKLNKGQFIAVGIVIFLGLLGFSAMKTGFENLNQSKDQYYEQYSFANIFVELDRAPKSIVSKIADLPGVERATGRISFKVNLYMPENPENVTAKIVSVPTDQTRYVNQMVLLQGKELTQGESDSVLVDQQFFVANQLQLGDYLYPIVNNKKFKLRLDGTATSPEFIYPLRSAQDLMPTPTEFGIFFVSEDFAETAFDYQEAVNEVVLTTHKDADIRAVKDEVEKLLKPYGIKGIIERKEQSSNAIFQGEIDGLANMATSFPVIFLLVAAIIIYIMMSRIVKTNRQQIGILKALGYSKWVVLRHFMAYGIFVGALGSVLGLLVGFYLGKQITQSYTLYFNLPIMVIQIHWQIFIPGLILGLAFCTAASFFATRSVLNISPTEAMKSELPKSGGPVIIENIKILWRRLSFEWKMIIRSIFRNFKRSFFVAIGMSFSVALIIVGLFSLDSFDFIVKENYYYMQRHDLKVTFAQPMDKRGIREVAKTYDIERAEGIFEYGFKFRNGWREENFAIVGLEPDIAMLRIRDSKGNEVSPPNEGLLISNQIAEKLDLQVGDEVEIKAVGYDDWKKARVKSIISQYIGSSAYASMDYLATLLGEKHAYTSVLLKVDPREYSQLIRDFRDIPTVAMVESRISTVNNFEKILESAIYSTFVIFLFGAVMGYAIIYNSTVISLGERMRELASLRVLGYSKEETARLLFRENRLLALFGIVIGLPLGNYFCWAVVESAKNDLYTMPVIIYPKTYLLAAASTYAFVLITQWFSRKKIYNLDIVEVLKNRE